MPHSAQSCRCLRGILFNSRPTAQADVNADVPQETEEKRAHVRARALTCQNRQGHKFLVTCGTVVVTTVLFSGNVGGMPCWNPLLRTTL